MLANMKNMNFEDGIEVFTRDIINDFKGLRTKKAFLPHEKIFRVEGKIIDYRTRWTLQIDNDIHIDPMDSNGNPNSAGYLNHSCDPTAYSLVLKVPESELPVMEIFALKQIKEGEEITVDYAFMESEIANGCECLCNSANCRGKIISFKQLDIKEIQSYLDKNIPLSMPLLKLFEAMEVG
jgi:SET domain-containing protein